MCYNPGIFKYSGIVAHSCSIRAQTMQSIPAPKAGNEKMNLDFNTDIFTKEKIEIGDTVEYVVR